ncbi:MAG: CesT family type III secretion system chaperone [Desulfovibrio sp.]|nr:CesT family type III secretion system chaperone [Desulfovibrio sp.]
MLSTAINDFGHRLGMENLAIGPEGVLALDISEVGRLYLELSRKNGQEELLIYLSCPLPAHDPDLARRALAASHYAQAHPWPLWAGIHKDSLMVLVRLNERQATGQTLENVALFLSESLKRICEGS